MAKSFSGPGPSGLGVMRTGSTYAGTENAARFVGSQIFTNRPESGTPEGMAYKMGENLLRQIQAGQSGEQLELAASEARKAQAVVDQEKADSSKISPAYWVTQKDFQNAFGRSYNPRNEQDRQDFFNLVRNAPGARRRTDVAGADVGAVVPTTTRPSSLPTFQDIGGVKVPESALGYTQREQEAARLSGFKTAEEAKAMGGAFSWKPEKSDSEIQKEVDKQLQLSKDLSKKGVFGTTVPEKKPTGGLPYSEREPNPLEDRMNALKFVQKYAPETLTQKPPQVEKPWTPFWSASDQGLYDLMKDASEAPELPPPAPDPESLSDLELARMKQDAKNAPPKGYKSWSDYNEYQLRRMEQGEPVGGEEGFGPGKREPSALEQGMRAIQGGQEFGKNLVSAAIGQGKKAKDKIGEIADRLRKQRENYASQIQQDVEGAGYRTQGEFTFPEELVQSKGIAASAMADQQRGQYEGPPQIPGLNDRNWTWNEKMGEWSYNLTPNFAYRRLPVEGQEAIDRLFPYVNLSRGQRTRRKKK